MKVEIYKNSGGSLMMAILENEKPIAIFENWECGPEWIIADAIDQLKENAEAWKTWDGDMVENANDRGGRCVDYDEDGEPIMEEYTLETLYNEISEDELIIEEYINPSIKEIIKSANMSQTKFAEHFEIPLRSVQNWVHGKRQCPEYIRKMIIKILESEEKEKLEITFSENTKKCLQLMLPYANTMYDCYYDFNTPEDIIRFALSCIMEEITAEYGEYVIDDKYGNVNQIFFPNMKNPLYVIDK